MGYGEEGLITVKRAKVGRMEALESLLGREEAGIHREKNRAGAIERE